MRTPVVLPAADFDVEPATIVVVTVLVMAGAAAWLWVRWGWQWALTLVRRYRGQCEHCGYDLRGTPGGPCPECGKTAGD